MESARSLFKRIYKVAMIVVTLVLAGGAILAYLNATTANGLLLIAGILAILTLMAAVSISKLDDQDRRAETYRQIGQDIRNLVKVSTTRTYAEPEVHRVDMAALEEARRMDQDGASIDENLPADRPRLRRPWPRRPRPGAPGGVPEDGPSDARRLSEIRREVG